LLVMPDVGTELPIFRHKYGRRLCRGQMFGREQLIAENY
jgi:hypothetical protein